ncbi:Fe-S oxidoreductase [Leucobacter zeae]|nr:Fe-S oxidoreductase [Leucobacter zeae]
MRMGARWRAGDPPHRGVPPELHAPIAEQEALHPGASSWTLTWLEGRPRCALDDLVLVTLDGVVPLQGAGTPGTEAGPGGALDEDDEDDDWLS